MYAYAYLAMAKSFLRYYPHVAVTVIDEGTLDEQVCRLLSVHIPGISIIRDQALRAHGIESRYSEHVRENRNAFSHVRKFTDVLAMTPGKRVILADADLLFVKRPARIISWIENKETSPLFNCESDVGDSLMVDRVQARERFSLAGPAHFNSGLLCFLNDFTRQEIERVTECVYVCRIGEFPSFLFEQSSYALLLGMRSAQALDPVLYQVYAGGRYAPEAHMVHFMRYGRYRNTLYVRLLNKLFRELRR
jgi:hypothetical protein